MSEAEVFYLFTVFVSLELAVGDTVVVCVLQQVSFYALAGFQVYFVPEIDRIGTSAM